MKQTVEIPRQATLKWLLAVTHALRTFRGAGFEMFAQQAIAAWMSRNMAPAVLSCSKNLTALRLQQYGPRHIPPKLLSSCKT